MTQAGKVAEIFTVAGEAFTKLGALAMSLEVSNDRPQEANKWDEEEIQMLKTSVKNFGADIEKISNRIKTKSAAQMKAALKQKAVSIASVKTSFPNTIIPTPSATIMTIPRPQFTVQGGSLPVTPLTTRQIGQKSKLVTPLEVAAIRGATPMNTQMAGVKKIRLDSNNMNALSSSGVSLNTIIRQSTPPVHIAPAGASIGLPVMASNQGFQVIVPSQPNTATVNGGGNTAVIPVSLLQSGIIQRVSNANTSGNVDVES